MRLLVVSNLYPPAAEGGYEMQCADTAEALSSEHEILVLTSAPRRARHGLASESANGCLVRRELPFLEQRRADTLRAPIWARAGARTMRATIDEWKPELIFFFNISDIPHSALWVAQESGIPIAFYVAEPSLRHIYERDRFARHLAGDDRGLRGVWAALMKLVNHSRELEIAVGRPFSASVAWVSEATRAQSPPPPFMHVEVGRVINPATRRYARFAAAERKEVDRPLIAFVGRLQMQKGPDVAIRAFSRLVNELGVEAEMEMLGPGEGAYVRSLQRLARELRVAERVTFRGPVGIDEVLGLFTRASLLVVPSVWQEPMATVCLEAAFARLPVVAAESGGMPEALRPDLEALYFPIAHWSACAEQLALTLRDPASTAARVARARARADDFTFDRYMTKIEEFVEAAVASARERETIV